MSDRYLAWKIQNMAPSGTWFRIENKADTAYVHIFDEISMFGVTAQNFIDELAQITAEHIVVSINSKGGDVFDGITIHNALVNHPARVTTQVEGIAASIASVIAQAGDERIVQRNGQLMIHDAHSATMGNAAEMRKMADVLEQQNDVIAGIYAERSGRGAQEFRALMSDTTWFKAQDAVDAGLADSVTEPRSKTNNSLGSDTPGAGDAESLETDAQAAWRERFMAALSDNDNEEDS